MRNALLSNLQLPSQFCSTGNNEAEIPYLDVCMQTETKGRNVIHGHGDAFSLESKIFNNGNQLRDGSITLPYQSHFNSHLQDYHCGSSNYGNYFQQFMSLGSGNLAIPNFESDVQNLQNGRKRRIEVHNEQMPLNEATAALNNDMWKKNKRKKHLSSSFEQQRFYSIDHQITESITEIKDFKLLHMPVRSSQKLGDKIRALQKLVSPYGKSDTASVLQEASLYIKLFQEQIQNLFQMLSSSYKSLEATHPQEIGKKQQDLRSRGLCLVPISFTQKVTKEETNIDTNSTSRATIITRKFC